MTRERRRNALIFGLIVQNHADMLLQERYVNIPLRMAVSISGYILRPVILVLFCHVLNPCGRFRAAWALAAVNGAVCLTASFSRLTFWIDEANHYQGGPLDQPSRVPGRVSEHGKQLKTRKHALSKQTVCKCQHIKF